VFGTLGSLRTRWLTLVTPWIAVTLAGCPTAPPVEPDPVVSLGLTLHLERAGILDNEAHYGDYLVELEDVVGWADGHGARLTLESRHLTQAILTHEDDPLDNLLAALQSSGHTVGFHADIGIEEGLTQELFTEQLTMGRAELAQVGIEARHVSGICSELDWVTAAAAAGFSFSTGQVAFCLKSLPEADQPEWVRDCEFPWDCHQPYPETVVGRLEPWHVVDGASWTTPVPLGQGELTVNHDGGLLECLAEDAAGGESNTACPFDDDDIEQYEIELQAAIDNATAEGVNDFTVVWSLGDPPEEEVFERWLSAIDPHVEDGLARWRTADEIHLMFQTLNGLAPGASP
jgi:hypothetical protein